MGPYSIVAYKPLDGKEAALIQLIKNHVPILRDEELVAESASSIVLRSKDGTIIEIFEWKSRDSVQLAHSNNAVNKMWVEFAEACEYISLDKVPETHDLFASFEPVEI